MIIVHTTARAVHQPIARIYGPAYLDRVLRVDAPLRPGAAIDGSVEGSIETSDGHALLLVQSDGSTLAIDPPPGWPGPWGTIRIGTPPGPPVAVSHGSVRGVAWHDDLGGMGAGFAKALDGRLTSALGPDDDPTTRAVTSLLAHHDIAHRPWVRPDRPADWTLLVTSGPHGDKLAIGFRGCHAALDTGDALAFDDEPPPDLLIVAGLPTAHSSAILSWAAARTLRILAPAIRTIRDTAPPAAALADRVDLLCCNRSEWEAAGADAIERLRERVALISVTDGPLGARLMMGLDERRVAAFPRSRPPRDTNRAGEAFASTLMLRLWHQGWRRGARLDPAGVVRAAIAASAAAALVLDLDRFGFPTAAATDAALRIGRVGPSRPER